MKNYFGIIFDYEDKKDECEFSNYCRSEVSANNS
jgi:hypothetical protein